MTEYREKTIRGEVTQLRRIADAMEEILSLVKKDMANVQKSIAEESEKKEVEGDSQAMNAFGD